MRVIERDLQRKKLLQQYYQDRLRLADVSHPVPNPSSRSKPKSSTHNRQDLRQPYERTIQVYDTPDVRQLSRSNKMSVPKTNRGAMAPTSSSLARVRSFYKPPTQALSVGRYGDAIEPPRSHSFIKNKQPLRLPTQLQARQTSRAPSQPRFRLTAQNLVQHQARQASRTPGKLGLTRR